MLKENKLNNRIEKMINEYNNSFLGGELINMSTDKYLSTGLEDLDELLNGGYKIAELTEISGTSNSGKTCLAINAINQLKNKLTIYIDSSSKLNESIFLDNDIDKSSFVIVKENNIMNLNNIIKTLEPIKSLIGLIVVDDLASLTTTAELNSSIRKNTDINRKKVVKGFLMRLNNFIYNSDITCLIINQLRTNFLEENPTSETVSCFESLINLACPTRIKLDISDTGETTVDITFKEKKIK